MSKKAKQDGLFGGGVSMIISGIRVFLFNEAIGHYSSIMWVSVEKRKETKSKILVILGRLYFFY